MGSEVGAWDGSGRSQRPGPPRPPQKALPSSLLWGPPSPSPAGSPRITGLRGGERRRLRDSLPRPLGAGEAGARSQLASGGSWKKRELRVSLPGAPAWVPCLLLPVRGHFHPPHLGSKGRIGWLTLTPGCQEVRNNLGLWVWPACLGGPPDGLGSSPGLAGVQHLAKGQHGAGHRQREGTRGQRQIPGTTLYSVPPQPGRRASGRRGTVALQGFWPGQPGWTSR